MNWGLRTTTGALALSLFASIEANAGSPFENEEANITYQDELAFQATQAASFLSTPTVEQPLASSVTQEADIPVASPDGYDDVAAYQASFQAMFGAPYSDELAPEPAPSNSIEIPDYTRNQSGSYYVVLGSFQDHARAQEKIRKTGIEMAFTKPKDINGTTYQRVLVGPMNQRDAELSRNQMIESGITDSWITQE